MTARHTGGVRFWDYPVRLPRVVRPPKNPSVTPRAIVLQVTHVRTRTCAPKLTGLKPKPLSRARPKADRGHPRPDVAYASCVLKRLGEAPARRARCRRVPHTPKLTGFSAPCVSAGVPEPRCVDESVPGASTGQQFRPTIHNHSGPSLLSRRRQAPKNPSGTPRAIVLQATHVRKRRQSVSSPCAL